MLLKRAFRILVVHPCCYDRDPFRILLTVTCLNASDMEAYAAQVFLLDIGSPVHFSCTVFGCNK